MKILKRKKGITLVALIITIIVLLILVGISLSFVFNGGILDKSQQVVNEYKSEVDKESNMLDKIDQYLKNQISGGNLEENKNKPNPPELMEGMTGIYWDKNGNEVVVTEDNKGNWYNYSEKKWANAKTKDGSYWVWIPRFEYSTDGTNFNVNFIPVSQTTVDDGYTHIHPAFRDGESINYINGEWDEEITGFWVAKYEAGFQSCTQSVDDSGIVIEPMIDESSVKYSDKVYTSSYDKVNALGQSIDLENTKISYPVFKPLTYSYNVISTGDEYTISQEVAKANSFYGLNENNTDSHMTKNSEWGAIIYLANSEYGRDGSYMELNSKNLNNLNNKNIYAVTGYAGDTPNGVGASSTGNITGVFDLCGGVSEQVSAYISDGSGSINIYAQSFAISTKDVEGYKTLSTKYATVYPFDEKSSYDFINNYNVYKNLQTEEYGFGDGILEYKTKLMQYVGENWVFFKRGSYIDGKIEENREFTVGSTAGVAYSFQGFRVILIKK